MQYVDSTTFGLAVAVGLGMLVGLQREWVADKPLGLRSFALIGTIGGLVGVFAGRYGVWVLAAGLLAMAGVICTHAYIRSRSSDGSGLTTELAALATFLVGALATSEYVAQAVALAGVITLLLHWKKQMHGWVERIGEVEFGAIARFVLVTLVVLPILPNQAYGPYAVLNPWQIWLMVVLIVSINLAGYVSLRISRNRGGALLSGVLGGIVSSTATTVGFATGSRERRLPAPVAAVVILLASALVYVRIGVEIAVVAVELLPVFIVPAAAFFVLFLLMVGVLLLRLPDAAEQEVEAKNPAELKTALGFALLYCVVLFVSAAVNDRFGETVLYAVAVVSGLTDVDALTLSVGRLFVEEHVGADTAWRLIFAASVSNLAFKTGIVAIIGGTALRQRLLPVMAALTSVGLAGTMLWP